MGHSHGRDNVKKRAARRKKTERLALAKSKKNTRERESRGVDGKAARGSWRKRGNMSDQSGDNVPEANLRYRVLK